MIFFCCQEFFITSAAYSWCQGTGTILFPKDYNKEHGL